MLALGVLENDGVADRRTNADVIRNGGIAEIGRSQSSQA